MSDLLPPNATPEMRAMSLAMAREIPVPLLTMWNPYECPANTLPWLAWALSVDEWNESWPETTKRQTIAASIGQHKIKGTVGAVKAALLRGLGRTVEINEDTGVPYTFGIRVKLLEGESSGGAIGADLMSRARAIANKTKNARSKLTDEAYFSETSPAPIYAGAALINGTEVEIKGEPTPLPLDSFRQYLTAAFFTVRVNTDYTGPIARVKRGSDNAELDYFSVSELAAFVDGTTFQYLRFYSQTPHFIVAKYLYGPSDGGFDSDGMPYSTMDEYEYNDGFVASYIDYDVPTVTLVGVSKIPIPVPSPSGCYPISASWPVGGNYFRIYDDGETPSMNGTLNGVSLFSGSVPSSFSDRRAVGGRYDGTNSVAQNGVDESHLMRVASGFKLAKMGVGRALVDAQFYGGALWKRDLGEVALNSAINELNTYFEE